MAKIHNFSLNIKDLIPPLTGDESPSLSHPKVSSGARYEHRRPHRKINFRLRPLAAVCLLLYASCFAALAADSSTYTPSEAEQKVQQAHPEQYEVMQKMPWMPHKGNSGHYDGQHYVQLSVSDLDSVAFKDITGTTDKNVLVSFFEYGGSKGRITPNTSNKQGPMYVTQDVMLSGTDNQYAAISEGKFHGIIDVDTTEEGMPWTIHYDFSADGSGSAGTPSTKNTSALNFFQNDMLETGAAGTRFLKFYNFLPQVNLLTQNQIAAVSNEGDSTAQLGISVTSKRQNITFKQETMFVSDFSFSDNDAGASSGLNMVAGVYNAFGAAHVTSSATVDGTDTDLQKALFGSEDNSVEPTEYASNMGVITFDKFATISISHINRTLYGVSDEENEVFGVLQNEGGTMTFRQGADIIAKGISKGMLDDQNSQPAIQAEAGEGGSSGAEETDAFVVAVGGISTLGVDDPLKQSRIQIYGNPDKVTHIWALSVPFEDANELSFYKDSTTGAVSSVNDWEADDLSQEALQQRWNDYMQSISQLDAGQQHSGAGQSFDMYNIDNRLGYAVMSLHGSEITISSDAEPLSRATEGATGVLDIRGDIMASTKNTSWSRSNTFKLEKSNPNYREDPPTGQTSHHKSRSLLGTVTRSEADVSLGAGSVLYGNVYERHRVGKIESVLAAGASVIYDDQSFVAWQQEQIKKEFATLGGNVNLTLSSGAVWYPQQLWYGWNRDILDNDFSEDMAGFMLMYKLGQYGSKGAIEYKNITAEKTSLNDTSKKVPDDGKTNDKTGKYELDYSSRADFSDQYNLYVYDEKAGSYQRSNFEYVAEEADTDNAGGAEVQVDAPESTEPATEEYSADKINDLTGNTEGQTAADGSTINMPHAYEKAGTYYNVDNGIYHLQLIGGTVDTRYMRNPYAFNTVAANGLSKINTAAAGGIKKLRIQEIQKGSTIGNFSIYARDAKNHDLIIIDEAPEDFTVNFSLWNADEFRQGLLGDKPAITDDPTTFIQIGRLASNIKVADKITEPLRDGELYRYTYSVKPDKNLNTKNPEAEDGSWTKAQKLEFRDGMTNWFITGYYKGEIDPDDPYDPYKPDNPDNPPCPPCPAPEIVQGVENAAGFAYGYAVIDIDRLQKRRGEIRYNNAHQEEDGMWARYRHINSGLSGNDDSADVIQVGYDWRVRNDESYSIYSLAFDYLHGESEFDHGGDDNELDRYSLSFYDTWLLDNGAYLDMTARVGWYDASVDSRYFADGRIYSVDGDFDFFGAGVGIEAGRKFSNQDKWFFEPQTQLTYTYIDSFDFTTSHQVKVDSDSIDSLIMRLGFRVGKDFGDKPDDAKWSLYFMGDALHEFLGQQDVKVTGQASGDTARLKFDGEQTWYDLGVGVSYELNDSSYFFVNFERALGADINNTWELDAGISVTF